MSNSAISHVSPVRPRRGLAGLLALAVALVAAAGALGARAWQVGATLGTALFPVEGIVELAAVTVGAVVAGWVAVHALVALAWVLVRRNGLRWAAGERAVTRHAPAIVRRLARAATGAGVGLALAVPTATALPDRSASDTDPAVVVELGWQPTGDRAHDREAAPRDPTASQARSAPGRSSLVDRGLRAASGRGQVVVVEPGDTLWAIAADGLVTDRTSLDPSDADIAAAVTRWHHANRQVLGTDPDLIHPGAVLRHP